MSQHLNEKGIEARARRVAKRAGFVACKSRGRESVDNHGEFMLINEIGNFVEAGERFSLTAQDVIDYCVAD